MKKIYIAGLIATITLTSMTASVFATSTVTEQKKIEEILTKIESLVESHPDQIAYTKAMELQSETTEKLTAADWKAIDAIHDAANKKRDAFLRSKNIPEIPKSILNAMDVDEPSDSTIDAYIEAGNKQSEAIEALSEADYRIYDGFYTEADKLQKEYMQAHGVKFVDPALEARIRDLDEQTTTLWNDMPDSYFENSDRDDNEAI